MDDLIKVNEVEHPPFMLSGESSNEVCPISIVLAALSLAPVRGFAGSRDVAGEFVVAEGLEVTLWAESPLLFKPTNINVDQRGRIWVAEGVNCRTFRGKDVNQPDAVPLRHPEGAREGPHQIQKSSRAIDDIGYRGNMQIEGAVPPGGKLGESCVANLKFLRKIFPPTA